MLHPLWYLSKGLEVVVDNHIGGHGVTAEVVKSLHEMIGHPFVIEVFDQHGDGFKSFENKSFLSWVFIALPAHCTLHAT